MKFFQVKTVEETFHLIEEHFFAIDGTETIPLWEAAGRILAEDIFVREDIPGFRRSSVDGFAVKAHETYGASESMPAFFDILAEVKMGEHVTFGLREGTACYVPTGGMLPEGSDAVVMIEHCEVNGDLLNVHRQLPPNENVIQSGEDCKYGELLLKSKQRLRSQEIGALAAQGIKEVVVFRRPVVGYLSTGDEIVSFEEESIEIGQIRDSNALTIGSLTKQWGYTFLYGGIIKDDEEELKRQAAKWIEKVDCLLISGGSSVGTKDYSVDVINSLGEPGVIVHGVAVKPGKPTIIANVDGKPVMGLPGHPASALIIYYLFGRKIMTRLSGQTEKPFLRVMDAISAKKIASAAGRTDYIRVRVYEENGIRMAEPILGKSGLLSTLVQSDGILEIPSRKEGIMAGEKVKIHIMD